MLGIYFNPRAPYGARRTIARCFISGKKFQSTRPIRGATFFVRRDVYIRAISIHAPHTGRDQALPEYHPEVSGISIHAPHTGRDIPANAL